MNRTHLFLFAAACLLLSTGCGADEEQQAPQPGLGVYHLSVTGYVESRLDDALLEELPDSIELEWPDSMKIDLTSYTESSTGSQVCGEHGCALGNNAEITVDGAAPVVGIVTRDGDAVDLSIWVHDYPFRPVDPRDCSFTFLYSAKFALRFEEGRAHGSGEATLECVVTQEDAPPLHQYLVILHLELVGERLPE